MEEGYLRFLEKREAGMNSMLNDLSLNLGFLMEMSEMQSKSSWV